MLLKILFAVFMTLWGATICLSPFMLKIEGMGCAVAFVAISAIPYLHLNLKHPPEGYFRKLSQ